MSEPGQKSGLETPWNNVRDHFIGKSCGEMQLSGAHETVMGRRLMVCVVFAKVGATRFPVYKELALDFTIFDPLEAYANSLGSLLINGIIG